MTEDRALSHPGARSGSVLADKYRLLGKLGEGGMGEVYAAEHTIVGRRFAVKFLRPEYARNEQIMTRFRREAQAAGGLESENVVAVTDFGYADDGAAFLVMEYLTGEDMRSLLVRTGRLGIKRAVEIALQACRGLHAAHARDIVHRDLKPENLFITKRGDGNDLVKILDFGIAKLRGAQAAGVDTGTGVVIGTLRYMPPEQIRGDKDTDHRADVYALGAILYEALSATLPHSGQDQESLMYHVLYEQPQPLAELRRDIPPELAAVVHRALASSVSERFQDIAALSAALAPFSGRQVTPLEGTTAQVAPTLPSPAVPRPSTAPDTVRALEAVGLSERRAAQRTAWWLIMTLLVLAGGGVLALALSSEDRPPPAAAPSASPLSTAPSGPPSAAVAPAVDVPPMPAANQAEVQPPPAARAPAPTPRSEPAPARGRSRPAEASPVAPAESPQAPVAPAESPPRPGSRFRVDERNPYE